MKKALALALMGLGCLSTRADIILDNIKEVRSGTTPLPSQQNIPVDYNSVAQSFTVGAGLTYNLTSVTIPVIYGGGGADSITVSLWDSHAMQPPFYMAGYQAPGEPIATIGVRSYSGDAAFITYETFTDFGDITLDEETYWLMVTQGDPQVNSVNWAQVSAHANPNYSETGTGSFWYKGSGNNVENGNWNLSMPPKTFGAMGLEGTLVAQVPEPTTMALALSAAGLLAFRATRRSRRVLGPAD